MYCKRCGSEIYENGNFCPLCGADQHEADSSANSFELVLRIFSIIFAFGFLISSLIDMLISLTSLLFVLLFFIFGVSPASLAVYFIIYALSAIARLWMVLVLILMAFRRTPKNTASLTFGVAVGGVALVVLRILLEAILKDRDYFWVFNLESSFAAYVLSILVCIVGVYLLLFTMRQAPELKTLLEDSSSKISEIKYTTKGLFIKLFNKRELNEVQVTSTDNRNTGDDGVVEEYVKTEEKDLSVPNEQNTSGAKRPIETKRSFIVYVILSFISYNIYGWYFIYCLSRDVNVMCGRDDKKMIGSLGYVLLNFITCGVYSFYCMYWCANQLASSAPRYGLNFKENGTTVLARYLLVAIGLGILFVCVNIKAYQLPFTGSFLLAVVFITNWFSSLVAMYIPIKNTNALATACNHSDI